MDVSKLMIGDKVIRFRVETKMIELGPNEFTSETKRNEEIDTVTGVGNGYVKFQYWSEMYHKYITFTVDADSIKPIPLDEDILKYAGWKDSSVRFYHDHAPFSIGYFEPAFGYPLCTDYAEDTFAFVNNVDELQRVLRCVGSYDLAKNFKLKDDKSHDRGRQEVPEGPSERTQHTDQ